MRSEEAEATYNRDGSGREASEALSVPVLHFLRRVARLIDPLPALVAVLLLLRLGAQPVRVDRLQLTRARWSEGRVKE